MQIAGEVGISQIHVSRLTRRALEKLRAELDRDPLTVRRPPTAPPTAAFDSARSSLE